MSGTTWQFLQCSWIHIRVVIRLLSHEVRGTPCARSTKTCQMSKIVKKWDFGIPGGGPGPPPKVPKMAIFQRLPIPKKYHEVPIWIVKKGSLFKINLPLMKKRGGGTPPLFGVPPKWRFSQIWQIFEPGTIWISDVRAGRRCSPLTPLHSCF